MRSIRPVRRRRGGSDEPAEVDETVARRMRTMAHPRFYAAQVGQPALAGDPEAAVAHFQEVGRQRGARISGLFNPDVYRERAGARGLAPAAGEDPFLHFLSVGWEERIVPTVLFDEEFYAARHPDLAHLPEWGFAQYARAGCYAPGRSPTPFGPNYGGGAPRPGARERQDPPLVDGLLHRADDHDLTRTSWLEAGVAAGTAKLAALGSGRMRDLVAKAAAIEPLIAQTPKERWVSWPPHTHPMVMPAARAEGVRRALGLVRADTVLVVAGGCEAAALDAVVARLHRDDPHATTVLVTTEDPAPPAVDVAATTVDLSAPWSGFTEHRRLLGLLDVVRGLHPRRVVVAGSELGWRLLSSYATTLAHETSLVAVVTGTAPFEDFHGCFDRLAWVAAGSDALRDDLVARYLLPSSAQARVLGPGDLAVRGG